MTKLKIKDQTVVGPPVIQETIGGGNYDIKIQQSLVL